MVKNTGYFAFNRDLCERPTTARYVDLREALSNNRHVLDTKDGAVDILSDVDIDKVVSRGVPFCNLEKTESGIYLWRCLVALPAVEFYNGEFTFINNKFRLGDILYSFTVKDSSICLREDDILRDTVCNMESRIFDIDFSTKLIRRIGKYTVAFIKFWLYGGDKPYSRGVAVFDDTGLVHFEIYDKTCKEHLRCKDFENKYGNKIVLMYN